MQAISDELVAARTSGPCRPRIATAVESAHAAYYAALALKPGTMGFAPMPAFPFSRLADCILETKADIEKAGYGTDRGHVGDANFHLVILFDPNDGGQRERAEALAHGVSFARDRHGRDVHRGTRDRLHKLDMLAREHGEAVDLMRAVKRAFDPFNIMNPGKTVPLQLTGKRVAR